MNSRVIKALPLMLAAALLTLVMALCLAPSTSYADEVEEATIETTNDLAPQARYWDRIYRVYGDSRYETMEQIVSPKYSYRYYYDENGKKQTAFHAKTVIVTTGENFPDALAATSLAGALKRDEIVDNRWMHDITPIVLTASNKLSTEAKATINRIKPEKIIVIGGKAAVGNDVYADLKKLTTKIERISGDNRIETSMKIYDKGKDKWGKTAILATGANFADALSISPFAYASKSPIFLVDSKLTSEQKKVLKKFDKVIICGGTGVISADVEKVAKGIVKEVKRLSGKNRYATSEAIARFSLNEKDELGYQYMSTNCIAFVSGNNFPDALAAAPVCGDESTPMLLIDNNNYSSTIKFLQKTYRNEAYIHSDRKFDEAVIYGGPAAVSDKVALELNKVLQKNYDEQRKPIS